MITHKQFPDHHIFETDIGGRTFTVETGKVAELCNAECICRYGDKMCIRDRHLPAASNHSFCSGMHIQTFDFLFSSNEIDTTDTPNKPIAIISSLYHTFLGG